jgi:hypothetical protein
VDTLHADGCVDGRCDSRNHIHGRTAATHLCAAHYVVRDIRVQGVRTEGSAVCTVLCKNGILLRPSVR